MSEQNLGFLNDKGAELDKQQTLLLENFPAMAIKYNLDTAKAVTDLAIVDTHQLNYQTAAAGDTQSKLDHATEAANRGPAKSVMRSIHKQMEGAGAKADDFANVGMPKRTAPYNFMTT